MRPNYARRFKEHHQEVVEDLGLDEEAIMAGTFNLVIFCFRQYAAWRPPNYTDANRFLNSQIGT
jgi:hypothetical protein